MGQPTLGPYPVRGVCSKGGAAFEFLTQKRSDSCLKSLGTSSTTFIGSYQSNLEDIHSRFESKNRSKTKRGVSLFDTKNPIKTRFYFKLIEGKPFYMIDKHNPKVLERKTTHNLRNRRFCIGKKFIYGFVQKSRYLGIPQEFEQSKNMVILTVRWGTTFVKKVFVGSRERKQREKVCVCVCVFVMFLQNGRKERKKGRKGKEKNGVGNASGFSRVVTSLVFLYTI